MNTFAILLAINFTHSAQTEEGVLKKFKWNGLRRFRVMDFREWGSGKDEPMVEEATVEVNEDSITWNLCGSVKTSYTEGQNAFFDVSVNNGESNFCGEDEAAYPAESILLKGLEGEGYSM